MDHNPLLTPAKPPFRHRPSMWLAIPAGFLIGTGLGVIAFWGLIILGVPLTLAGLYIGKKLA